LLRPDILSRRRAERYGQGHLLLRRADYISEMVGPENVGLGFDFSQADDDSYEYFGYDERYYPRPPWTYPLGIRSWADAPNVTAGLKTRGYTDDQIRGILGENFLRVFGKLRAS
jgi:membrane dipeptidase